VVVDVERHGASARVAVHDTGVGIPPAEQHYVFERFYRADRARSRSTGGTGLGLAIARALVRAHHGEIGLESQPGRGTTVWFTLPLRPHA
jgi:signal transduction histidine kinase